LLRKQKRKNPDQLKAKSLLRRGNGYPEEGKEERLSSRKTKLVRSLVSRKGEPQLDHLTPEGRGGESRYRCSRCAEEIKKENQTGPFGDTRGRKEKARVSCGVIVRRISKRRRKRCLASYFAFPKRGKERGKAYPMGGQRGREKLTPFISFARKRRKKKKGEVSLEASIR